ncbi:ubiquitin-related domain-containing protein, partial [Boletus edulis BED1]
PSIPQTPQVSLTFLLVSGHRKSQSFDPETTVGRVKELVWNAWPAHWQDERPPAPSYLRILYLGKILQDDDTLLRVGFPTSLPPASNATPTIVHLSIRPYALPSDD